jgi:hypothetical protein
MRKTARRVGAKSSRKTVPPHRKGLRQQGLCPITIWVPNMRSPDFATEAHRQSLSVANSPYDEQHQDFIDSVAVLSANEL